MYVWHGSKYLDLPRELVDALHVEVEYDGVFVRLFAVCTDEFLVIYIYICV